MVLETTIVEGVRDADSRVVKLEDASSARRFYFIDALRGLAAMGVVLFHVEEGKHLKTVLERSPHFVTSLFKAGQFGVPVFFVISGFVIAQSLSGTRINGSSSLRFIVRRQLRLDPTYWVAIALTVAFALISARFVPGKQAPDYSPQLIVAHAFYVQDLLGFDQINGAFWTLCFEIQFYLAYILFLWALGGDPATTGRKDGYVLIGTVTFLSLLWAFGLGPLAPSGVSAPLVAGFFVGVFCNWAFRDERFRAPFLLYAGALLLAGVLTSRGFWLASSITAAIIFFVAAKNRLQLTRDMAWLQFLGVISYSLYLFHTPVTGAGYRVGFMVTGRSAFTEAFWLPVVLAECILFSLLMWRLVERPSMMLSRRFKA